MPAIPKKPREGIPDPASELISKAGVFEAIVEAFLEEHADLTEGQIDSARSILTEFQAKGNAFQNSNKEKLAEIALRQRGAMTARDRKKVSEADIERKALLQPFHLLVEEMQVRLDGLLTTAQRERHVQRQATGDKSTAGNSGGKADKERLDPAKSAPSQQAKSSTGNVQPNQGSTPPEEKTPGE
jgi:hypothetical protein